MMFILRIDLVQITDNENSIVIYRKDEGCANTEQVKESSRRFMRELKKWIDDRLGCE